MRPLVFERYVQPARRRPQLWRLVLGLLLCGLVYAAVVAAVFVASVMWSRRTGGAPLVTPWTPGGTLILLATFVGMALGPMVAVRLLHGRTAGSLFGPAARVLRDFVAATAITGAVLGVALAFWALRYEAVPNLEAGLWLTLLPLTLLGLVVQTGAEEVLFRGYFTQSLAARFKARAIWMGVPALAFGLLHLDPFAARGVELWAIVGGAAVFGLLAADLTAVTGSLGAAWGVHFANNLVAIAVLSTKGTITGLSLYVTPYDMAQVDPQVLVGDAVLLVLGWVVIRRALAR